LAAVRPLIASDAELDRHYRAAQQAVTGGDALDAGVADALLDGLTRRLSTLAPGTRDAIEKMVARGLIESRSFLRRKLFARAPVCATLRIPAENVSFLACLSDGAAEQLPLMPSFRVRLIVEPRAADDAGQSVALRVVALARVVERLR
jgi:hypothetical protein